MSLCSILIATHKRNDVLQWNLKSLSEQKNDVEIIVLDDFYISDNECKQLVKQYERQLNIKYIHSGKTKQGKNIWRVPGYAYNIGSKLASSDIIVLCCGEMYHVGNTIQYIANKIQDDPNLLCTVRGVDDRKGFFLNKLKKGQPITINDCGAAEFGLTVYLPFCLGVSKHQFMTVGGYDETFTGMGYEDDDLVERLLRLGCKHSVRRLDSPRYYEVNIDIPMDLWVIHLFSPHIKGEKSTNDLIELNKQLFLKNNADNKIHVNTTINWGKL